VHIATRTVRRAIYLAVMASASVLAGPLWGTGIVVAAAFYVALAYLAVVGLRIAAGASRSALRQQRLRRRASLFDGQAHPTLLEVAVARARQERERQQDLRGARARDARATARDARSLRRAPERRTPSRRAA
jgi:hypothetical protein